MPGTREGSEEEREEEPGPDEDQRRRRCGYNWPDFSEKAVEASLACRAPPILPLVFLPLLLPRYPQLPPPSLQPPPPLLLLLPLLRPPPPVPGLGQDYDQYGVLQALWDPWQDSA